MKNTVSKTINGKDAVVNIPQSIYDFLKKSSATSPEGGEITLAQVEKHFPTVLKRELVAALKSRNSGGVYVPGRRGHESRWLHGKNAEEAAEKMKITRRYARSAAQSGAPRKYRRRQEIVPTDAAPTSVTASQTGGQYEVRINIGGHQTVIPMSVDLVPQAA